jgi:hypothetical protein
MIWVGNGLAYQHEKSIRPKKLKHATVALRLSLHQREKRSPQPLAD